MSILLASAFFLLGPASGTAQTSDDCTPDPAPIDFDDLSAGDEYVIGDSFRSGAASLTVLPFDAASVEFGAITVDPAEPDGEAGGSGLELFVNDVLADFSFPTRIDGISLRLLHGTGVGRLVLNDVSRDVSFGFPELDGQTVGGVLVSISEGETADLMTLVGQIESFAIGGGELYIDEVAPRALCPDLAIQVSTPQPVERGSGLRFTISVDNLGTAAADRTTVALSSPRFDPVNAPIGPLPPGRSERIELTVPIPRELFGQTEEFTVTADPGGVVNETTFDNNEATLPVPLPSPDLSLIVGSWTITDDRVQIPIGISNEGDAPSRLTIVTVTGEGWPSASEDVRRLGADRSVNITLDVAIPESARGNASALTITLDPEEVVADLDRSDNVRQVIVEIPLIGDAADTGGARWPTLVVAALIVAVLMAYLIWRLVRPHPVPTVSARLRPGRTELVLIPKPDGGPHHAVRLVPRHDPGVQVLQRGAEPR